MSSLACVSLGLVGSGAQTWRLLQCLRLAVVPLEFVISYACDLLMKVGLSALVISPDGFLDRALESSYLCLGAGRQPLHTLG